MRDRATDLIHGRRMDDRPQRYPSDTSDEQWAVIEPLLPPVKTGGRPEKHPHGVFDLGPVGQCRHVGDDTNPGTVGGAQPVREVARSGLSGDDAGGGSVGSPT